jgi:Pyruvate/2-oxoacid:ferredoxin oxidoreductase delta subunit
MAQKDMAVKVVKPPKPHVKMRRCDDCGIAFPEEEIVVEKNQNGTILGYYCEGCVAWL